MAHYRRNNMWFGFFFVLTAVCGWMIVTYASAGTDFACSGKGSGTIKFVTSPIPKFACVGPTYQG